jgi:hypothetical protein
MPFQKHHRNAKLENAAQGKGRIKRQLPLCGKSFISVWNVIFLLQ